MIKKRVRTGNELAISTDECAKKIPNKYDMVIIASARARELAHGVPCLVDGDHKPTVMAMKEIAAGLVGYEVLDRIKKK